MAKFCVNCGTLLNKHGECPMCGEPLPKEQEQVKAVQPAEESPVVTAAETAEKAPVELQETKPAEGEKPAQEPKKEADKPEDKAPPRKSRYAPVSTFSFLIMLILLCIPVLNIILLLVWARRDCRRINRRNFARAVLWLILLAAIAAGAVYFFGDVLFGPIVRQYAVQLEQWGLGSLVTMWG